MTVIKITAITVPAEGGDEVTRRFAARAGAGDPQPGFESFELLKPTDERSTWLVLTRWVDEESFRSWANSPESGHAHLGAADQASAPRVPLGSELWSYEIAGGSERSFRDRRTPTQRETATITSRLAVKLQGRRISLPNKAGPADDEARSRDDHLWAQAHTERTALAEDLSGLNAEQWRLSTLCGRWDVEHVVAHLTAAASLNQWRWVQSMVGARFRPDVHNQRRLAEHWGRTPAETLDRFRAVASSTIAPSSHTPAYLGEILVHAQDIRQPLGLPRTPPVDALTPVAYFFARRDFTVASRTTVAGLQLRANDGPFATGTGPLVTGSTLALVMSMAGRSAYVDQLDGPGVPTLRARVHGTGPSHAA
jgi:uncharacterized protein (TIGR03083 family)